jgi:hypothetical protein
MGAGVRLANLEYKDDQLNKTACSMLNKEQSVQVSDTTKVA